MKTCSICRRCFEDVESMCIEAAHGELVDTPHSVDQVTGYRIERIIARSPAVGIYQALNLAYGQSCFLAIASSETSKFVSDAERAAGYFSARVAGVIESGEMADESAYAVSEACSGRSLREIMESESISMRDSIVIARQAAEAAHELHLMASVHGAIRPENISIARSGDSVAVRLHNIDFGQAFASSALSNRFAMESARSELKYYAPEQFSGEAPGPASDVYALGIILYELLSGHTPFDADSATAIADMQLYQKPPDIVIENFDLRMLLTHTISEALQKKPAFRQSTADLFARQMRHIEQLATHVSTPPPAVRSRVTEARPDATPRYMVSVPLLAAVEAPQPRKVDLVEIRREAQNAALIPDGQIKRSRLKGMKRHLQSQMPRSVASVPADPDAIQMIEWQQPEDDIPSLDAVRAERDATRPGAILGDEITQARAATVKRIEVDLSQPSEDTFAPDFLPNLLSTGRIGSSDDSRSTMFATLEPVERFRKLPVYSAVLAVIVLAGVSVVRIADRTAPTGTNYVSENDDLPVQAPPVRIDARMTEAPTAPVLAAVPVEHSEQTGAVPAVAAAQRTKRGNVSDEPAAKASKAASSVPKTSTQPDITRSVVPSTIVISTKGGRPIRAVVENKRSEVQPKAAGSSNGATRPRIVKTNE